MDPDFDRQQRQTAEVLLLRDQGKIQEALDLLIIKLPYIEFYPNEYLQALMIRADLQDRLNQPMDSMATYRQVVLEAHELEEVEVQKAAFKGCINMLYRHRKELWVESVRKEARNHGFRINIYGEEYVGVESEDEWTPEKTRKKRPRRISSSSEDDDDDERA